MGETRQFDTYEIRFATEENYQSASLIKFESEIDLAILKIDNESIKYDAVEFANSSYSYGDKVYAIGIKLVELFNNKKNVVYLGRYEGGSYDGYVQTALRNENAIFFSTRNWEFLEKNFAMKESGF